MVNDPKSVDLLINVGANMNADYFHNETALELASKYSYQKCIELLIAVGKIGKIGKIQLIRIKITLECFYFGLQG